LGQVCDGLALAHRAGIVHRDLKPHNVMLTRDGQGAELAKLVDFGIAKTFEVDTHTQLTAEGSTLGTPHYMSPEQATGRDVDHRSDIYSLGIILYEMLTGDVPFNDPSLPAVLVKHLTETPKPPTARRPDLAIPAALDALVLKCLEKDPTARCQSAEELAAALRTTVSHTGADGATIPLSAAAAAAEPTLPLPRATPPVTNIPPVPSIPNSAPASPSLATGAG